VSFAEVGLDAESLWRRGRTGVSIVDGEKMLAGDRGSAVPHRRGADNAAHMMRTQGFTQPIGLKDLIEA
jgi:hypothetical protein